MSPTTHENDIEYASEYDIAYESEYGIAYASEYDIGYDSENLSSDRGELGVRINGEKAVSVSDSI